MLRKLKVYSGPTHPHAAQRPEAYEVAHARRQVI
jgi:ribosomal protein L13